MPLKVNGVLLSAETEKFKYNSKKTGQREDGTRVTLILQGEFGVICGNLVSFNSNTDVSGFKVGAKTSIEIEEFKVVDGIQTAKFRV